MASLNIRHWLFRGADVHTKLPAVGSELVMTDVWVYTGMDVWENCWKFVRDAVIQEVTQDKGATIALLNVVGDTKDDHDRCSNLGYVSLYVHRYAHLGLWHSDIVGYRNTHWKPLWTSNCRDQHIAIDSDYPPLACEERCYIQDAIGDPAKAPVPPSLSDKVRKQMAQLPGAALQAGSNLVGALPQAPQQARKLGSAVQQAGANVKGALLQQMSRLSR